MKLATIAGIILLVLGALGLLYGGFRYTTRESVMDVGPIHLSAERRHSVPVAPITGAALVLAGVVVLVVARRGAP